MTYNAPVDPALHDWQSCSIYFPRFVKLVDSHGVHTRLIMPGRYLVRRSRSLRRWIYRKPSS